MLNKLLLIFLVLATAGALQAATVVCGSTGLSKFSDYVAMTAAGDDCTIGSATFSNFWYTFVGSIGEDPADDPVTDAHIGVSPILAATGPALEFAAAFHLAEAGTFIWRWGYDVVDTLPVQLVAISQTGIGQTGGGQAEVAKVVTVDETDLDPLVISAPASSYPIIGHPDATSFSVFDQITLQVTGAGTAGVSSFTNTFTDNLVPEPASIFLTSASLLAVGLLKRRAA